MSGFHLVRAVTVNPSETKAYRVQSVDLVTETAATALLQSLSDRSVLHRVVGVMPGTGTASAYRVETLALMTEPEAMTVMRNLGSPYRGHKYLPQ